MIAPTTLPFGAVRYEVVQWQINAPFVLNGSTITGFIGDPSNNSESFIDTNFNGFSNPMSYPIKWGDVGPTYVDIQAYALVYYYDDNDVLVFNEYTQTKYKEVNIRRITNPIISGVNSVLNCNQSTFTQTVSAGEANNFTWNISGGSADGAIVSGQGTNQVVIMPPTSGGFNVEVIAKRNQANPNYSITGSKSFVRSNRVVDYTIVPLTISGVTFTPDYMCKTVGREVEIDDDPYFTSVSLNAPNCTVTSQGIVNGKRKYLIMPNTSITNGSLVQVSATANYQGGCSATSISKSLFVYESATPPMPSGYIYMTPIGGTNACDAEGFEVHFSGSYANGITTISPAILPPHAGSRPRQFQVCYINRCSGVKVCKSVTGYPPAPCDNYKMTSTPLFDLYTNPNKGQFNIQFDTIETGMFIIYDFYGNKMMSQSFKASKKVSVQSRKILPSGIYFIEVTTSTTSEKQKFIVN